MLLSIINSQAFQLTALGIIAVGALFRQKIIFQNDPYGEFPNRINAALIASAVILLGAILLRYFDHQNAKLSVDFKETLFFVGKIALLCGILLFKTYFSSIFLGLTLCKIFYNYIYDGALLYFESIESFLDIFFSNAPDSLKFVYGIGMGISLLYGTIEDS